MTGIEWMIEAFGCSAAILCDKTALRELFDVIVATTNGAAPNPLKVGHAIRCSRCRVGRELRFLRHPRLGLWEFRSPWRIKGLSASSSWQHQDEKHGRQRRQGGEKPIAHLMPLSRGRFLELSPTHG